MNIDKGALSRGDRGEAIIESTHVGLQSSGLRLQLGAWEARGVDLQHRARRFALPPAVARRRDALGWTYRTQLALPDLPGVTNDKEGPGHLVSIASRCKGLLPERAHEASPCIRRRDMCSVRHENSRP
jgi:hypothetical protein